MDLSFGRKVKDSVKEEKDNNATNEVEVGGTKEFQAEGENSKYAYLDQNFVKSETFKRIVSLSREQLDNIAKKLSIFAYNKLKKDELLKRILLIYESE